LALNVINPPINIWILIIDLLSVGFVGAVSLFFVCLLAKVRGAILRALFWKAGKKPAPIRYTRFIDAEASVDSSKTGIKAPNDILLVTSYCPLFFFRTLIR